MIDWQKQLNEVENKLTRKETEHGSNQTANRSVRVLRQLRSGRSNGSSVRNDSSSAGNSSRSKRSDVLCRPGTQEVTNLMKGGYVLMITAKGLFDDFAAIDKDVKYTTDYARLSAKLEKLAKVVLNCRTNTVKVMDKLGIPREEKKEDAKPPVQQ